MSSTCDYGVSRSSGYARLAGLTFCVLLAAACHGGVDNPAAPSASAAAVISPTDGDDESDAGAVASVMSAPIQYEMTDVGNSGYSGTCSLAAARLGFRLKAQGQGTPESVIRFHLIMPDGFRTTAYVDVSRQGTFRTGQSLVTSFPSGIEVRCVLLAIDGTLLAESTAFHAP